MHSSVPTCSRKPSQKNGEAISAPRDGRTAVANGRTSIQHACLTFDVSETCYRYRARRPDEDAVIADWLILDRGYKESWGFGLCYLHLRNVKGFTWNHKRVYRIYRALELNLRIKPRKRLVREVPQPLAVPTAINACGRWTSCMTH